MNNVGSISFNSGNHIPVHQTPSLPKKDNLVDSKMSSLSKTLFKGALLGLAIGGAALYYMRNSSSPDAPNSDAPKVPELPKNICTIPEYAHMCENNFGIPRKEMPQIEGGVKGDFLNFLKNQTETGLNVVRTVIKAPDLTPIQNEMNTGKILGMVKDYKAGKFDPCKEEILVIVDDKGGNGEPVNYVLDGHHRYAACYLLDRQMNVIAIVDQVKKVLNSALSFPGVTKADL